MRAVVVREFGPPEVLEPAEVEEVRAGPGEAVIDVEFANVTFVETQIRAGRPPHPSMLPQLPAILGNGVGGTVARPGADAGLAGADAGLADVGTGLAGADAGLGGADAGLGGADAGLAGADAGLAGRRVVASLNGTGGYAERVAVDARRLIEVPDGLGLREAVALLADGRTALALAGRAELRAGDTVLVEAAAGGVGTLLVQIARNAGARVVALAGQQRKLAVARDLGAGLAVDYRAGDWPERVRDAVGQVDVVFDGVGGDIGLAAFGLLGRGGRFCAFGMASGSFAPVTAELARAREVALLQGGGAGPQELAGLAREALAEAAAGRIRPVVGQEFALDAAAAAHAAIEARATIGKTLLTVAR